MEAAQTQADLKYQLELDAYIRRSDKIYRETADLMDSILRKKNKTFETIVSQKKFEAEKDEIAFRKTLYKATIKNHLKQDMVAWARFFMNDHLHSKCARVHYEFARDLTDRDLKRIAYAATRGIGKSTWTSLICPLFNILNVFEHNIVIVSSNDSSVKKIIANIQSELRNNKRILEFYGDKSDQKKWSEGNFIWGDTQVTGYGIGSPLRVSKYKQWRITLAILDDIETRDVLSLIQNKDKDELMRDKDYVYKEVDPAMEPLGRIHFIGTIFHPEAILPFMMKSANYKSKIWSAIYQDQEGNDCSIFPERFDIQFFIDKKNELIEQGMAETWYSEYMNTPNSTENKIFGRVTRYQDEELRSKYSRMVFFQGFDLATGHGHDKTASVVIARDTISEGNVYVVDTLNKKLDIDEGMEEIVTQAGRYQLLSTHAQNDLMLMTNEKHLRSIALRRDVAFPLRTDNLHQASSSTRMGNSKVSKVKKEVRLSYLTTFIKAGKLRVSPAMTELIDQIENYPFVRFDDLLDALYEAVFNSNPSDGKIKTQAELDAEKSQEIWDKLMEKLGKNRAATTNGDDDNFGKWENHEGIDFD